MNCSTNKLLHCIEKAADNVISNFEAAVPEKPQPSNHASVSVALSFQVLSGNLIDRERGSLDEFTFFQHQNWYSAAKMTLPPNVSSNK
mmetsp:Transcript_26857/g.48761  ORF Transcript_26857/g.48761 Transcript_26857/m.48761 type:complete len:88 (-) Transcript_26857:853-1116(-)